MSILTDLVGLTSDTSSDDPVAQAWKLLKGRPKDETANAEPVTQKITYNPDGSQSHTISATTPAKPMSPMEDYNAYIAGQESSNNPNIGYHDRSKSSAYGTYGITEPAYQDIQKADPRFAGRGITDLSPEEQRAANEVLKAQYERQLQAKGVEPTEGNVRLAHLLGAGGAHQYLTQGTFNQAAMDANGGEERLRQLAQQRLASAGGAQQQAQGPARPVAPQQPGVQLAAGGPVSDVMPTPNEMAVQQLGQQNRPQGGPVAPGQQPPMPPQAGEAGTQLAGPPTSAMGPDAWVTRFATAQQDPKMLSNIAFDTNAPKWVRSMAEQNLGTQIQNKREAQTAQELVNQSMTTGDMKPLAGAMSQQDGSWVKYYLFNRLGLGSAAQNEAVKLGLLDKTVQAMGPNGEYGLLKMNGRGEPVGGVKADGTPLTPQEAVDWASRGAANSQVIRTANTQAVAAYKTEQMRLQREADTLLSSGVPPATLKQYGLDPASIEQRSRSAAGNVRRAALEGYGMNNNAAPGGPVPSSDQGNAAGNIPQGGAQIGAQPGVQAGPVLYPTETGKPSILENWNQPKQGEGATALANRLKNSSPEEIESAAQSLAKGDAKPSDFSGRDQNFRRYALQRAMEINPNYNTGTYAIVQNKVKDITSGKTSQTLTNMGTAVDHALEYKDLLSQIPATNVSSWNAFIQGVSKYGNAPEVKSKEALAGFLSGELVKAATGTGGGVGEREELQKQILAANTPAEVRKIIDTQLALGHARYTNIKRNYEGTTKRDDFKEISPLSETAAAEYERLDKNAAAKKWLKDNPNDPKAPAVRKKLGLE